MSYTKGPWHVDGVEIVADNGSCVVWESGSNWEADGPLIAAAPDLYHACEVALNDRMYKDWPDVADILKAALAKADGNKP